MTWYYDSHVHLSYPYYTEYLDCIFLGMKKIKLKACCVSTNIFDSQCTLKIAQSTRLVLPVIGIHPECANDNLELMTEIVHQNNKFISGIGEIGLDPTYTQTKTDKKRQIHVFETLLSLAEKYRKPISIHSRKSLDDVLQIMTSYDTKHALLHWFDGNKRQLQKAMDMDFFVSYGPAMIYA
ncbi:MAG: TatD family hydrolase, partial [Candidatus Nitrosomaritimum yanchengensis]